MVFGKNTALRILVLLVLATPSFAQDAFTLHDPGDQAHWYGYECCHLKDCAPVTVHIVNDRYVWNSHLFPGETRSVPIQNHPDLKRSQDGRFHACEYRLISPPTDTVNGVYCLYVPPGM